MGTASLAPKHGPPTRGWRTFLVHQSVAMWGALFVAPATVILFCEAASHIGIRSSLPQGQWALYGTRFFPIQIALALFAGWVLGGTLPQRAALWIWVLPLVALCLALNGISLLPPPSPAFILFPPIDDLNITQAVNLGFSSRLSRFFGPGVGLQPFDQVSVTLPLYSAVAYALGAWLASGALRAQAFFEAMRNLRKGRLLLFVTLPWFCLKLGVNWQRASAQYPVLRTWPVLGALLVMLAMGAAFVTFVFALAVALAGRRFCLTRFFLFAAQPS